ncbi:MAG TPA: PAS domain-containing protein [Dongiaceae bacterium]|nr:PAS domain-containing protein [Dongiaceae bacterium]
MTFATSQPWGSVKVDPAKAEVDPSVFAPDIVAFHAYWNRKRRGRRMPARADIDPAEIVPFLPGIMLVDAVADARRFVYRLVGTREVAMRGRDPTGKSVSEGFYGASAETSIASYQDVLARRALRLERREFTTPDGRFGREQVILLPLSNDDARVNMVLVYTHHIVG